MTTYRSKIGLEIVIPISIVIAGTAGLMVYQKIGLGLMTVFLLALFIVHMFLTTYYVIDNGKLIIRCGFLYHKAIDIDTIRKISATNLALSSPATSLDRMELLYNKFDSVLISPKDKEGLLKKLLEINPSIEVKNNEGRFFY
jgi:hypothetical protein